MIALRNTSIDMKWAIWAMMAGLLMILVGCASVTKEECLTGNWDEIGYRDGTNGQTQDYIKQHEKSCERVDVTPNMSVWNAARLRGVPVYCVPQRAYTEGRSGNDVSPVCSADVMPALVAANDKGQRYYRLSQNIRELEDTVSDLESAQFSAKDDKSKFAIGLRIRNVESRIRRLEDQRRHVASL